MLDREMTLRAAEERRAPRTAVDRRVRPARPAPQLAESPDPAPRRHEVVVQGMRITLPGLRFMEIPPPGSPRR
ncbi:hypothetical protein [Salinarimonas chemoclinalis]|uniref:hypothetical protein n=1 Tax=Salinarimonas chemoclinalis TaxID=3241599 RepID=UPI0035561F89